MIFKSFLKNYFGENLLLKTKLLINNGDDLFVKSIFVSCILLIHTHITQWTFSLLLKNKTQIPILSSFELECYSLIQCSVWGLGLSPNVLSDIFLIDFFLSLICNKTASIRDKLWSIIDMQWWNEGSSWGEIDQQRNIWSKACVLERQIFFTWGS